MFDVARAPISRGSHNACRDCSVGLCEQVKRNSGSAKMELWISIVGGLALLLFTFLLILRTCARVPELRRCQAWLVFCACIWAAFFLFKQAWPDAIMPPADADWHHDMGVEVAKAFHLGGWRDAASMFGVGNAGFDFVIGLMYSVTSPNRPLITAVLTVFAFWGGLLLLELLVKGTGAARIPWLLVAFITMCPTAVFWSVDVLKEGPVYWGSCAALHACLGGSRGGHRQSLLLPIIGICVVAFMRPHIAMVWIAALGFGAVMVAGRWGFAFLLVLVAGVSTHLLYTMIPDVMDDMGSRGIVETVQSEYQLRSQLGGSAIQYVSGKPIPVLSGMLLLTLRPFPTEIPSLLAIIPTAEVWFLSFIGLWNWQRLRNRYAVLLSPVIATALGAFIMFSFQFSYMYNMGLMIRQRLMVLPAMFMLSFVPLLARQVSEMAGTREVLSNARLWRLHLQQNH